MDATVAECRTLVAGVGNIFLTDDAFGVAVARRLASMRLPGSVTVADFGIRPLRLACELIEGKYDRVVLLDAFPHGGAPGALAVVNAETTSDAADLLDSHSMHPAAVLAFIRAIGEMPPPTTLLGCEPESIEEGIGMSPPVEAAVDKAVGVVLNLLADRDRPRA
jgi:hydrogenase maturation protease